MLPVGCRVHQDQRLGTEVAGVCVLWVLFLMHTHTHTYTPSLSLSLSHTHTHTLSLSLKVLAELEKNWWTDVEDIIHGTMSPADAFFFSLLQHETSLQNFELLCCLRNVDTSQGDIFYSARQLQ